MVSATFLAVSLFVGYAVAVGLLMAATFGITSASPAFVAKDYRIRRRYKFVQDAIWLVCITVGAYATALIIGKDHAWLNWIAGPALVAILIGVLWINSWEMRQRGVGHQVLISAMTVAGVAAGFALRLR
jgi:hypothetical protein